MKTPLTISIGIMLACTVGCGAGPAAPFNSMKSANVQAFRLQNYEPPAQAAAAATPLGGIPGLPPEITQWAQQALPGLQQLLPPGLLPPGLLQGMGQAQAPAPPPPSAPRFPVSAPNFVILGQTQIIDPDLKEQLAELFGDEDSFQADHSNCMYAEMGVSFSSGGALNDMLVSFSCNQVEARGFAWPHPYRGMKPKTVEKLAGLVGKIWPQG
jgi:hypothetical protein